MSDGAVLEVSQEGPGHNPSHQHGNQQSASNQQHAAEQSIHRPKHLQIHGRGEANHKNHRRADPGRLGAAPVPAIHQRCHRDLQQRHRRRNCSEIGQEEKGHSHNSSGRADGGQSCWQRQKDRADRGLTHGIPQPEADHYGEGEHARQQTHRGVQPHNCDRFLRNGSLAVEISRIRHDRTDAGADREEGLAERITDGGDIHQFPAVPAQQEGLVTIDRSRQRAGPDRQGHQQQEKKR